MKKRVSFVLLAGMGFILGLLFGMNQTASVVWAQASGSSFRQPPAIPTGRLSELYQIGQSDKAPYFQPVFFDVPENVKIRPVSADSLKTSGNAVYDSVYGLIVGRVYRLQMINLPFDSSQQLYPTVEILNRLYPPEGMEFDFPIRVEITEEDLRLASEGNLVTRVVFLEAPWCAMPSVGTAAPRLSYDVSRAKNPVAVAGMFGRPMLILRIGSRQPMESDNVDSAFYFGCPEFMLSPKDVGSSDAVSAENISSSDTLLNESDHLNNLK